MSSSSQPPGSAPSDWDDDDLDDEFPIPDCNPAALAFHRHTHLCFGMDGPLGEL